MSRRSSGGLKSGVVIALALLELLWLASGDFQIEAYQDGVNANRYGGDYKLVKSHVNKATRLKIKLPEGGGWAARIDPVK